MKTRTATDKPAPLSAPIAISYIRFSTPEQMKGDSLRRQTEATEQWCLKHGVKLDASLSLRDLGRSAFHGKHRSDKAALGAFLKLVEEGKVPKGSFLIIENLDRLSREDERTAMKLWIDILDHGVNIVQLSPETVFRHERSDMTDIIRAIIELSRGHSESRMKSERVGKAWGNKRTKLREDGELFTNRLPLWVEEKDGRPQLIEERAAVVKRIFQMAAEGHGQGLIVKRLEAEKVKAFGEREPGENGRHRAKNGNHYGSGRWTRTYIAKILNDRRALGEFQPRVNGRKDGPPVPNYYPGVVSEEEFYRAMAGSASRRKPGKPGRIGEYINLFAHLIRNARPGPGHGAPYYCTSRTDRVHGTQYRILINDAVNRLGPGHSFPMPSFERAVLSRLAEIDIAKVLGKNDGPADLDVIQGELDWVRGKRAELEAELLKGDVSAIATALRNLEARERELMDKLEGAREEAAVPLADTWQQARQTINELSRQRLQALDNAPDVQDARLRLRAALRRVIDEIWLLVASRGRDRLAMVEVHFTGGAVRTYEILHRPPAVNRHTSRPGRWWVVTCKHPEKVPPTFTLSNPEHAEKELRQVEAEARGERDVIGSSWDPRRFGGGYTEEIPLQS
jgi:DNA invertase Pin-like site-specific DNA recombinase